MWFQTRHIIILLLLSIFAFNSFAQNVIYHGSTEEDLVNAMVLYDNSYYLCGTTRNSGESASNYYVLELNNNGSLKNEFVFGNTHRDIGKYIHVNQNGIHILGKTWDGGYPNNDMYLTNLDFSGKQKWHKYYGGTKNDLGHKFIQTADGGFALVGFNRSVDDFGDAYLVKTDKDGEIQWEKNFGEKYIDHGFDVAENTIGELVVVGTKGGFFNPTSTDFRNHDADIYVIKTSANGEKIWEKTYGGTSHDWAKKIIVAPGGGYFICGSTQSYGAGSFDFFLMKMDEDGNELWMKTYGGIDYDYGETLAISADNNLYLLGSSASYSINYMPDFFLVKTDLDGNLIWQSTFGGEYADYGTSLVATSDSGCAISGGSKNGDIGKTDIAFYKISKNGETEIVSSIPPVNDSIDQIKVYPNPVKKNLTINIDSDYNTSFQFEIFNASGIIVYQTDIYSNTNNNIRVNFAPGFYFYTILSSNKKISSGKLIFH